MVYDGGMPEKGGYLTAGRALWRAWELQSRINQYPDLGQAVKMARPQASFFAQGLRMPEQTVLPLLLSISGTLYPSIRVMVAVA